MKTGTLFAFLAFWMNLMNPSCLRAEIKTVVVTWNRKLCSDSCVKLLEEQFKKGKNYNSFRIDQSRGEARMQWKPGKRLTYESAMKPLQHVGLGYNVFYVVVRGTIKQKGDKIFLISSGDNTEFDLISPITDKYPARVPKARAARHLSKQHKEQLLKAAQQNKVVEIDGPLFLPSYPPPFVLEIRRL